MPAEKSSPRPTGYLQPDSATSPARPKRVRLHHLAQAKAEGRKLTMLTAYDVMTARIFDAAGLDMLLVGDSMGNVVLGHGSTLEVSLADMERATGAVSRGVQRAFIVADMPFGTYEGDPVAAFDNAVCLMKAGAQGVKVEGGARIAPTVARLTAAGIPVMGHLGYTPQSEHALGGPRLQGRGAAAEAMLADAHALVEAGVFAIVLEMVPDDIATEVTQAISVPTIGIGAGPNTDGQVLVWADMAGMNEWTPRFVRRFAEVGQVLREAALEYVSAVEDGTFPAEGNYHRH